MSNEDRGRFVWYDLMSTDPEASQAFYTQLIGWGTQVWEGQADMPYTMWTNGETPLGGVKPLPKEAADADAPPHWLSYIATPDVDATAAKATELGGNVLMPAMDIPDVGRFAVLADPQGAVFAAFAPAGDTPGNPGPAKVGEFSWHELMATDYGAAFDFYSELFGWEKQEAMDMGEAGIYQMYGRPNSPPLGGMFNKPPEMPACWLFYVSIPDMDAAVAKLKELGAQILNGPMEVPGGNMIVQALDPQGAAFALHSTAAKE